MKPDASDDRTRDALLTAWHQRYRAPLLRFFERRTRPDVDREDLVQEVFSRLAKRDDLTNVDHVEAYLFQAAASVLTDWSRRGRVRAHGAHVPLDEELQSDTALSPERVLLGKEAIEELGRALAELPARTQTVFALYHFEDTPHRVIAQRLGVSLSTVEKDMAKANLHILERLGPPRAR